MSVVKEFENQVKESHASLERGGAAVFTKLRQMKGSEDVNEIEEHLTELKHLKHPIEEMIKFLENFKTKITETELHMYETLGGVESRKKTGRSLKGGNNDSGCFSADSRVMSAGSMLIAQASHADQSTREDDVTSSSRIVTSIHTAPTQHEDTSDMEKLNIDDSAY